MYTDVYKRFLENRSGATAVEFAIVMPLLAASLLGVVHMGSYFFGVHQAQAACDETAREVRLVSSPTADEIKALLVEALPKPISGSYEPTVEIIDQYGADYAEITVTYVYPHGIPFTTTAEFRSEAKTQVLLRDMP